MSIVESRSISKPPYFDGKNCTEWKKFMMLFVKSNDFNLWLVIKNGQKIPKKVINGEEIEKSEDEFDAKDMKIMKREAKAKHILCCALNPDDLKRVSSLNTAKEMWDELDKLSVSFLLININDLLLQYSLELIVEKYIMCLTGKFQHLMLNLSL